MKQKLLSFLIFWFYINGRPKTRLGYIVQPLLPITIGVIVIVILNSLFPSCEAMLKTKNEFLRISENKKALAVEADMKRSNCSN